jgi:carboxymethylenebutenolidase
MSIFRRSTCRWSERLAAGVLVLALLAPALALRGQPTPPPAPPTFLEAFRDTKEATVTTRDVRFPSAIGTVTGYLARPDTTERLPALILLSDEGGLTDWTRGNARDMAGIGYVVLAVDLRAAHRRAVDVEELTLAETTAAVRWLRHRRDVRPAQVGVAGWGWGADQALSLASATPLQACVLCDGRATPDEAQLAGLRGTPLLLIMGGKDRARTANLPALRKALTAARVPHRIKVYADAAPGFMGPPGRKAYAHDPAETAWVEVYEFLGKHVEDADQAPSVTPAAAGERPIATVADLMRSVNAPTGPRGALALALEKEPGTARDWQRVRANAALVAEAGRLLGRHTPRKGTRRDWQEQSHAFTAAAEAVVAGADRRDYAAAQRGLRDLAARCALCHKGHR